MVGTIDSIHIHDITIIHAGCIGGQVGVSGDFWGNSQGAFNIGPTSNYSLQNISVYNVDIIDARHYGIYMHTNNGHQITATTLHNVLIKNAANYGFYIGSYSGQIEYCDIIYDDCNYNHTNYNISQIVENCDFKNSVLSVYEDLTNDGSDIYNMQGKLVIQGATSSDIGTLPAGVYIQRSVTYIYKTIISR